MTRYDITDDFKSGKYDELFRVYNAYQDSLNEYTPIRPSTFSRLQLAKLASSIPQFPFIVSKWQATVGQNDSTVYIQSSDNISDRTKQLKKRIESRIYDLFYKKLKWAEIEKEVLALVAAEGNAVVMLNNQAEIIVHSIYRFNIYRNPDQKTTRYAFIDAGGVETKLNNLIHGVDIFHIKDPVFAHFPIAPSRLEVAYSYIILEQKGVKANTNLFANGFLSNLFLKFDYDKMPSQVKDQTKDKNGKTWFDRLMETLNDKFAGVSKMARVGHIFGLDSIIEAGKNNKDTQFYEMIKELTPERIAWAFSMTLSDFGAGKNTTYNNASTFDDALYDKIGRPLEKILDSVRNDFIAPLFQMYGSTSTYIKYNEPADPNRLNEIKEWRNDYIAGLITVDEFRDKRGLEPIDPSLLLTEAEPKGETTVFSQKKKTIVEKTLEGKEYTIFTNKLKKAVQKQIENYIEKIEKKGEKETTVELEKFESFFSFSAFRDSLKKFALIGYNEAVETITAKFAKSDDAFGVYTDEVMDMINSRIDSLLNGSSEFKSIDEETASQIQTILSQNIELGVSQIAVKIKEKIKDISRNRAELIAQMEVVNAVESTRNTIYKENNYKYKRALNNSPKTDECQSNKAEGVVDFDHVYSHTIGNGLYPPFHFRCKTSLVYGEEKEELQ
jgi:hypothetical protein